jgi:hypothetical protein
MQHMPTQHEIEELERKIASFLPHWAVIGLYQRHGRWVARVMYHGSIVDDLTTSEMLTRAHEARPQGWKLGLTNKTAKAVEAMCRQLLRRNPNNKFVREQYPQLFAEITAGQHEATTHQGNTYGAQG